MPVHEWIITRLIQVSGYLSIFFVGLISVFLSTEGSPALAEAPFSSLFGERWYPIEGYYSIWPLLSGFLIITVSAVMAVLPLGIGTAVYVS